MYRADQAFNARQAVVRARKLTYLRTMRKKIRSMRNSSVLTASFPKVRQGVRAALLRQPEMWWYLSERQIGTPRSTKPPRRNWINMRALIARDLADASLAGLSADRRFTTAYNTALQAANMAIACAGIGS